LTGFVERRLEKSGHLSLILKREVFFMSFSLEAALVVPLALATWFAMIAAAVPVYGDVRQAAVLEIQASVLSVDSSCLYKAARLDSGDAWTTGLQTSPAVLLELYCLALDDCRLLLRLLPETPSTDEPGQGST
jgi:hypothetical protein